MDCVHNSTLGVANFVDANNDKEVVDLQGLITGSFALSGMAMQSAIHVYACVSLHV